MGNNENHRSGEGYESIKKDIAEHLKYNMGVDRYSKTQLDEFKSVAMTVRDRLVGQWLETQRTHHRENAKRVYYLSLEFLMGRALTNNIINLGIKNEFTKALEELGYSLEELEEQEMDAGLGNGGLGRLAACFMDSIASLDYPGFGYGIRYEYGIFKQKIEGGQQVEEPDDWLRNGDIWEIERPEFAIDVNFYGRVISVEEHGKLNYKWVDTQKIVGVPYDMPIVGYGGTTVNTLRLWASKGKEEFSFNDFNEGDYMDAVNDKIVAENISKVLYPNDKGYLGKELRLKQQYFFVACSIADIVRRFEKANKPLSELPNFAAIQLNDTHPSIAVAELMRVLLDEKFMSWEESWGIVTKCLGYTNHTLLPEALEKWAVSMFEYLLPRHLQIIYQINHEFLQQVSIKFNGDANKMKAMSIIEEGHNKSIRMAYLSIVGSHSVNGVAAIHSDLIKKSLVPDFAQMYPEKFNNKTNGITQRRWLLKANPGLSSLITETLGGDHWVKNLDDLTKLKPYAKDSSFREKFKNAKNQAKENLAKALKINSGIVIDTTHILDIQVKRIHEYKRQLLNALHIIMLYSKIKNGQLNKQSLVPRTFLFGGKAAPGYYNAKKIIKLINNISKTINNDKEVNDVLRVHFVPNYRVSLAEKIMAGANVSEQISTAGTEASGTGNMKFMLNGALTVGTLDGANIEMAEEVGNDNIFIFGLTEEQVTDLKPRYNPKQYYLENSNIKQTLDLLLTTNTFCYGEDGIFDIFRHILLDGGDNYMHLADLQSYADTHHRVMELYKNQDLWFEKAILNTASSGKFSSDRTIHEYAKEIWGLKQVMIPKNKSNDAIEEAKKN